MNILLLLPFYDPEKKKTTSGVDYHRLYAPMRHLSDEVEKINVHIARGMMDVTEKQLKDMDVVHFNSNTCILYEQNGKPQVIDTKEAILNCKKAGVKVWLDLDDYWVQPKLHYKYAIRCKPNPFAMLTGNKSIPTHKSVMSQTIDAILHADIISVSTPPLKDLVEKANPKAEVWLVPNAISKQDPQFMGDKETDKDYVTFAFSRQISRPNDLYLLKEYMEAVKDLKGFRMLYLGYNPKDKGSVACHRALSVNETLDTDVYSYRPFISPDIYGHYYKDVDVLFNPIGLANRSEEELRFDACKSDLKILECGFTNTAYMGLTDEYDYLNSTNHFSFEKSLESMVEATKFALSNPDLIVKRAAYLSEDAEHKEMGKVNHIRKLILQ